MYNYVVKQLRNLQLQIQPFKLQIQPRGPLSNPFNPDLDVFQGITLIFRETIYERNQNMYNDIVAKLQYFKLQMQSTVNLLDLNKVTSQNIFVSDDLNPDLYPFQAIAPVFSKTSDFFTPLQCLCDLEHIFQHIFVSSNMPPDPYADIASREIFFSSNMDPDLDPVQ